MEDDQGLDKPYRAEYAKSSRSNCKACKTQIAKDVLRLGVMVQSPVHDGKIPNWYHFMCFFGKQRPKTITDIAHFDSMRWEDQEKIREKIKELNAAPPPEEKGKKATKRGKKNGSGGFGDFSVEYAKSSRAVCQGCEIKIAKDEVRISKKDFESEKARRFGGMDRWHHVDCFSKLRAELEFFASGENLPGYNTLKHEDKAAVLSALPSISAPKVKEEKSEDVADGAPLSKKSKKDDSSKDNPLEELMKKQNKMMFKFRDQLEALTKNQLSALLEYNNQDDPVGRDRKLDRLQDAMAFGALAPCTVCKEGKFIFASGVGYQCQGDLTEWTKCLHTEEKPKRLPFKVPEDLASTFDFLGKYKCKLGERAFIKEASVKKEKAEPSTSAKIEKFAPFRGMVFFLFGRNLKDKKTLKSSIEKWGGTVASKLTDDVVVVISDEDEVNKMSPKMQDIHDLNIHVVPESYVDACKDGNPLEKIKEMSISSWGGEVAKKVDKHLQKSAALKSGSGKSAYTKSVSSVKLKVVGGTAVDPDSEMADVTHVYKEGGEAWTCVLGLTDIQSNKNSYYKIQLLEANDAKRYWVFRAWGRIGTTIGGKKLEKASSLDEAKKIFKGVYLDRGGNRWKDRHNFVKKPGYMYPIDIDYGESDQYKMDEESAIPSKLAPAVQDLIKMIFNVDMMKKIMMEFELDMEKMPLGKLSKKQIQKAYGILSELQEKDGDIKPQIITDATNRFYTLIPHSFGVDSAPLLDNKEIIQSKLQMLESLMEMEVAYSLLKETQGHGDSTHHPIDSHYLKLNADIQVLERESEEFQFVEKYVRNTHGETHTQYTLDIVDIFKVKRNGEDRRFKPFKKLHNRKLLWHGSRVTNFVGILSQGLRIAPPEAPVCGYMFGKGIYFADMVSKSANYCATSPSNPYGLLLLCEVALGDMYERTRADFIEKLPPGKHSTKGLGITMPDPKESVIKEDGLEVPLGKPVKQFADRSATSLLYNEYIVYDVAQVKFQYLLKLKFNYVTY